MLQRSLNRLASPVAISATATEHGRQLASAVDWTLRLLCKMCIWLCKLCVSGLDVGTRWHPSIRWHPLAPVGTRVSRDRWHLLTHTCVYVYVYIVYIILTPPHHTPSHPTRPHTSPPPLAGNPGLLVVSPPLLVLFLPSPTYTPTAKSTRSF